MRVTSASLLVPFILYLVEVLDPGSMEEARFLLEATAVINYY